MNTPKRTLAALLAPALLALAPLNVHAAGIVIQDHAGTVPAPSPSAVDGDLVTAGDQFWSGGTGSAVDDGGTAAWRTIDNTASLPWTVDVPLASITEGSTNGWILSWEVKAVLGSAAFGASQNPTLAIFDFGGSSENWRLGVGVQADGDQEIQLDSNSASAVSYTAEGEGEVYHLYELVFDPGTSTADLFVDGIERISDYAGPTLSGSAVDVFWGDGSTGTSTTRSGNHTLVQWETLPEPSRTLLVIIGVLGILLHRRK